MSYNKQRIMTWCKEMKWKQGLGCFIWVPIPNIPYIGLLGTPKLMKYLKYLEK